MFNPLPAIALLPVALLWFGIGTPSLIFVIVHSVLWPVALACYGGFLAVPPTLRMAGRNLGLSGGRFVVEILVPAAFPQILSGLRIGWAFAWRTLIAAELVFGVSARSGGLRLVYLHQPRTVGDGQRVRGTAHGHPDRPRRRKASSSDADADYRSALEPGAGLSEQSAAAIPEAQRSPDGGIVPSNQPMIVLVLNSQIACLGL